MKCIQRDQMVESREHFLRLFWFCFTRYFSLSSLKDYFFVRACSILHHFEIIFLKIDFLSYLSVSLSWKESFEMYYHCQQSYTYVYKISVYQPHRFILFHLPILIENCIILFRIYLENFFFLGCLTKEVTEKCIIFGETPTSSHKMLSCLSPKLESGSAHPCLQIATVLFATLLDRQKLDLTIKQCWTLQATYQVRFIK